MFDVIHITSRHNPPTSAGDVSSAVRGTEAQDGVLGSTRQLRGGNGALWDATRDADRAGEACPGVEQDLGVCEKRLVQATDTIGEAACLLKGVHLRKLESVEEFLIVSGDAQKRPAVAQSILADQAVKVQDLHRGGDAFSVRPVKVAEGVVEAAAKAGVG